MIVRVSAVPRRTLYVYADVDVSTAWKSQPQSHVMITSQVVETSVSVPINKHRSSCFYIHADDIVLATFSWV